MEKRSDDEQRHPREKKKKAKLAATIVEREIDAPMLAALKQWRLKRSHADKVPAFVILHDATLEHLCWSRPGSLLQLRNTPGIGDLKLERYGKEILEVLHKK